MRGPAIVRIDTHPPDQLLALFASLIPGLLIRGHFSGDGSLSGALFWISGLGTTGSRQVTNVTHARLHNEVFSEVFVNGFRLGGRLHYDQCFTHKLRLPASAERPTDIVGR